MNRCYLLLVLFVCVNISHEDCPQNTIRKRQKCYYYDGDYLGLRFINLYIKEEDACWTHVDSKALICYREKQIPVVTTGLTSLELLDGDISTITLNAFRDMPDLFTVNITNCNVSKVELGAFNGINKLQNISLSNNAITRITKGVFNHLLHLKRLNVSMNQINYVEEGSFLGPDLKEIYITNNEIENVSPFVENCLELTVFDISYNKVSSLESIGNCTSLLELYASNNRLRELSPNLFKQLQLRTLDLSSNLLDDMDIETFNGLPALDTLDLSKNKISELPNIGMLQHLQNLRKLNLSSNSLTNLQLGIFAMPSSLEILDISNNKLNSLPEEMFHDLGNLKRIYIQHNLITSFNGPKTELVHINIDGNPWSCQELAKLVTMYKYAMTRGENHNTSNIFGITCIPSTSNKMTISVDSKLNENDKIYHERLLDLFSQSENMSIAIQTVLQEIQNNNKNQNLFNENFSTILKENQNASDVWKDFLRVIVTKSSLDSRKSTDNLEEFSQKIEQQFENLLTIFNNTLHEREEVRSNFAFVNTLNSSHTQENNTSKKLVRDNIAIPHTTENSNIFLGVLVVLTVLLIVFSLSVVYFIRSVKIYHQSRRMDDMQL